MKGKAGRSYHGGFYKKLMDSPETVDYERAVIASRDYVNGRRKKTGLYDIRASLPRDQLLYTQTDALANIGLDNSRDERQAEQDRKNGERMARVKMHTAAKKAEMDARIKNYASPLFSAPLQDKKTERPNDDYTT